ncbi:Crp/Fnr family transcriptional regulator [Streptomyces sp. PB17]|uniref:Crp/Fnr family transcriptional regulator n=1 Tax=unclassified Streptomyces TaxID=2593676 RepID=UPI0038B62794
MIDQSKARLYLLRVTATAKLPDAGVDLDAGPALPGSPRSLTTASPTSNSACPTASSRPSPGASPPPWTPSPPHSRPARPLRPTARHPQIALTHEQIAALAGTSRETCTKTLRDFAERGLLRLARGRITVLDAARLRDEAGNSATR